MNNQEKIKSAMTRLVEQGKLDVVDEFFSTGYVAHAGDKDYRGHEFIKRYSKELKSALPDVRVVKIKFLLEADETIAWLRKLSGTHKGGMRGIPASDKKVVWTEMVVSRFEKGKIAEEWVISDLAGQLFSKQSK